MSEQQLRVGEETQKGVHRVLLLLEMRSVLAGRSLKQSLRF